jgi:isochorismate synthase EntC
VIRGEHPSDEAWVQRVETALSAIRTGRLRKVVLTRRTRVRATAVLEARHVLRLAATVTAVNADPRAFAVAPGSFR